MASWQSDDYRADGEKHAHRSVREIHPICSKNVPHLLGGVTELTTGHTGRKTVVANTDGVILERVGKVIVTLSHGPDKDRDAFLGTQRLNVILGAYHRSLKTHGDLATVGGQVVGNGVLDDLQQLLLGVGGSNRQTVEQLDHQTSESLEGSGNADGGVDFDQDSLGGVDEDLEATGLVDGRIQEGKKTLTSTVTVSKNNERRGARNKK